MVEVRKAKEQSELRLGRNNGKRFLVMFKRKRKVKEVISLLCEDGKVATDGKGRVLVLHRLFLRGEK